MSSAEMGATGPTEVEESPIPTTEPMKGNDVAEPVTEEVAVESEPVTEPRGEASSTEPAGEQDPESTLSESNVSGMSRREQLRAKLRNSEQQRIARIPESDEETKSVDDNKSTISEDSGVFRKSSRRDELRAKLRQSEQRLLKFTRSGDGQEGIFSQMAAVEENLKKVEEEKSMLAIELTKLQTKTDDQNDEFLKEKMGHIQDGFQKQVEKIQALQEDLQVKDDEITMLREDLVKKLRRIVELEFDLETHSVHFTNYAREQFKLGEEALAELKGTVQPRNFDGDESVSSMGDASIRSTTTKRTASQRKSQKLISKLLGDLDDLEARYKADRLDAASEIHQAQMIMEQLRTRIQVLEQQEKKWEASSSAKMSTNTSKQNPGVHESPLGKDDDTLQVQVLRSRNQTLEARRILAQKEIDRLNEEIGVAKTRTKELEREHKASMERLRTENDALRSRIEELETGKEKKGIMRKMRRNSVDQVKSNNFNMIDSRIKGCYEKIAVLEAERSIKDRQIATLKNEVASLRMRDIANGKIEKTNFTKTDSDLLQSPTGRHRMHTMNKDGDINGPDSTYVADLQSQLTEAQQLLVKKDQELVIERAKSASTVAGLLARITELSNKKGGESKGDGKQLPLRFYL